MRTRDEFKRTKIASGNPAAQLALMWDHAGCEVGSKNIVVLPVGDDFELFSKYTQQLVMESPGNGQVRSDLVVHQSITRHGNKGSTDQHYYHQTASHAT